MELSNDKCAERYRLCTYKRPDMIRKLKSGTYRLYSRKVDPKTGRWRNLGTFTSRGAAEKHERAVQFSSTADEPTPRVERLIWGALHLWRLSAEIVVH
jgi:hypothetical protein